MPPSLEHPSNTADIPEPLARSPGSPQAPQHSAWHKVLTGESSLKSPKRPGSFSHPHQGSRSEAVADPRHTWEWIRNLNTELRQFAKGHKEKTLRDRLESKDTSRVNMVEKKFSPSNRAPSTLACKGQNAPSVQSQTWIQPASSLIPLTETVLG